jgi:hypothetical protein
MSDALKVITYNKQLAARSEALTGTKIEIT